MRTAAASWRDLPRYEGPRAAYRLGYSFGPSYAYTDCTALPQPLVTRYHLSDNSRYLQRNGDVYAVNPRTYRVVRVIPG